LGRFTRTRALVGAMAVATLALGACGGQGASSAWKTATSAAGGGGMDALVTAAKAEGKLNVIALPPDWADYGDMIKDFGAKYGIAVTSDNPDGTSSDEINAVNQKKGTDKAPDVLDLGINVALANTNLFAPYQISSWADIPAGLKESTGLWVSDYAGYESIGCNTAKVDPPAKLTDLLDPKYKGLVALNGDPTTASAGFHGVVLAALANGGSADNLAPGVEFFKKLSDQGILLPVDPNPATIKSGQTPCVIDWLYTNRAQTDALKKDGIDYKVTIPTDAPPVAAYYIQAINKDAPHPAAARLWEEYLYSDAGQNTWLKGYAVPVLFDKMKAANTLDAAALANLPTTSQPAITLTQDQLTKGQDYLKSNWTITIK
jgi:putative spermidine/putrescine transport system substrate-binding protein